MKHSEKSSIFVGIVLLLLAAYFTIALMIEFVGFDVALLVSQIFFMGQILKGAYGFTSLCIPIVLFSGAIVIFRIKFQPRSAVLLGSSIIPFYTVFAAERLLVKILPDSILPIYILKLSATIILALLLVVIEYVAVGVIFDSIYASISKNNKTQSRENEKEPVVREQMHFSEKPIEVPSTELPEVKVTEAVVNNEEIGENSEVENSAAEIVEENVSSEKNIEELPVEEIKVEKIDFEKCPKFDYSCLYQTDNAESRFLEDPFDEEEFSEIIEDKIDAAVKGAFESVREEIKLGFAEARAENSENTENEFEIEKTEVVVQNPEESIIPSVIEEISEIVEEPVLEEVEQKSVESEPEVYEISLGKKDEKSIVVDFNNHQVISEEEKMNLAVPLMSIKLGEDDEDNDDNKESNNSAQDNENLIEEVDISEFDNDEKSDEVYDFASNSNDEQKIELPTETNASENETQEITLFADELYDDDIVFEGDKKEEIIENDDLEIEEDDENDLDEDDDIVFDESKVEEIEVPVVPKKVNNKPYEIPTEGLLTSYPDGEYWIIDDETKEAAVKLKDILNEFKIEAEVTGIKKGPVVTMFELVPAPGVKLSKIVALSDNIALGLAASSVRIVAPIPGKSAVGIEIPNRERSIVSFKEIIEKENPGFKKMAVPVVLGKDITGEAQVIDLAKTPHLLIAGATGAGKSVCVNSLILSILYKRSPRDVKMILIDPKVVELKLYNDIPHLLTPVITEPKKAFQALQYCLCEMERRYACLDSMGVRDLESYNRRIVERHIATEKMPYIVVIIDEFADLMATTGKELESTIARLAAMSRAVGIHLVLATQRPSIDVITGLIKANIPTRIAFMVASKTDSRIIIDQVGADKLLGKGDMLYASATDPFPVRIQGTFVSDNEVENVVEYVKQYGEPEYIDEEIFVDDDDDEGIGPSLFSDGEDPLYNQALEIVVQAGKASASYIQRRLKIGYNRAARLVEEMEERGIVGPQNGSKPREIIHIP